VFDTAAVAEIDVISEMADKHCYSAADSNVSKRRSAHSSSRDHLDKEPAVPGEQVGKEAEAAAAANSTCHAEAVFLSRLLPKWLGRMGRGSWVTSWTTTL